MREEHQDAVERPDEIEIVVRVQELKAEESEDGTFDELDEFVDLRQKLNRHFD